MGVEKDLNKVFGEVNNSNLKMGRGEIGGVLFPKCCCCIDLKTGVVVLGVLSAIATENAMIGFTIISGFGALIFGKMSQDGPSIMDRMDKSSQDATLVYFILSAIFFFIHLISSILLSVGASKESPRLLIPWMITSLLGIAWHCVSIVLAFVLPFWYFSPTGQLISSLFCILLTIYFEVVVLSLYNKFNDYSPVRQNI